MEKKNRENENIDKNWFSKHAETLTVIASLLGGFMWMDSKFSSMESRFDSKIERLDTRLSSVEKDVAVIKTILSIKGINCNDLVFREDNTEERNKGK